MCEKFSNLHNKHSGGSKKNERTKKRRKREQEATIVNSFNPKFFLIKQLFYPQHIFCAILRLHFFVSFCRVFFFRFVKMYSGALHVIKLHQLFALSGKSSSVPLSFVSFNEFIKLMFSHEKSCWRQTKWKCVFRNFIAVLIEAEKIRILFSSSSDTWVYGNPCQKEVERNDEKVFLMFATEVHQFMPPTVDGKWKFNENGFYCKRYLWTRWIICGELRNCFHLFFSSIAGNYTIK